MHRVLSWKPLGRGRGLSRSAGFHNGSFCGQGGRDAVGHPRAQTGAHVVVLVGDDPPLAQVLQQHRVVGGVHQLGTADMDHRRLQILDIIAGIDDAWLGDYARPGSQETTDAGSSSRD